MSTNSQSVSPRDSSSLQHSHLVADIAVVNVGPATTQRELTEIGKLMETYNSAHSPMRTLALFEWMLNIIDVKPDLACYLHAIRACGEVKNAELCRRVHQFIENDRTLADQEYEQLQSKLIYMYAKMQRMDVAEEIFRRAKTRNLGLFGTMFKGYNMNGQAAKTIELYEREVMKLDAITATCVLNAASDCRRLDVGKHVHAEVMRLQLLDPPNIRLATALMDMYCQCGSIDRAREIFDRFLPIVDAVAYSTLMKAYNASNQPVQVLSLFRQLQSSSITPDPLLYSSVIRACQQLGLAHQAESIHRAIPAYVIEKSPALQSVLIAMHAHCSHFDEAKRMFRLVEQKDGKTLASLIHALAVNGQGRQALSLFEEMKTQVKLNALVYKMLLSACAFTDGLVDEARHIYRSLPDKYKAPDVAAVMVTILSRASQFDEVQAFIHQYQSISSNIFPLQLAFFMVCYHSKNLHYATLIHKQMPDDPYVSLLLADMTGTAPSDEVIDYFRRQAPGRCWTETRNNGGTGYALHEFDDGDLSKSSALNAELKSMGVNWEPMANDCQALFCGHTAARLALAHNLQSSPTETVQLTKTKPLCHTCHEGMKQLTAVRRCDIILKDPVRVHRFREGRCSCNDRF